MKETDLILGAFADNGMADLDDATLALYEELLEENDNELYTWFTGSAETPAVFQKLVQLISKAHNLN
jgi:antitoxin CptB